MSTKRKEIRQALTALLVAANIPNVMGKVYPSRARKIMPGELPVIAVYTRGEPTIEEFSQAPLEYKRHVNLVVEVIAKADENLDNTLDDIAQLVENVVFRNPTLSDKANDTRLSKIDEDILGEGETQFGACALTFDCTYLSYAPEDITADLPPLEEVNAKYDLAPVDGKIAAEDTIELPQPETP